VIRALTCAQASLSLLLGNTAQAQNYPEKPVRIVMPFAPGGLTDNVVRVMSAKLAERLGQQVIIDSRPGANGNIGTQVVAQSAPDGYTLLAGFQGTLVINPFVYPKLPFDPVADFAPITILGDGTLILVAHPSVAANNIRELIALAKSKPGSLSFASTGTGSTSHLTGELLKQRAGIDMVHIPYKGGGQAVGDAIGGQVPLLFTSVSTVAQHIKAGKLRALGISAARRSDALPDVPTFIENGLPDFVASSWIGLLAPAKTPSPIIARLHREAVAALQAPEVRERYAALGIDPVGNTPEQYRDRIRADMARWEKVVRQAKIRLE
jgi:tripartite-type tricarboxylate transporter receptor subunit TctC